MKNDISVIIPFLNEEDNIIDLCDTLENFVVEKSFSVEVIFVDDGSTDRSVDILSKYKFKSLSAKVIKLSRNYGSHAALRAGVSRASGDYCMFFSADLQEPVELISLLYERVIQGYDMVGVQKGEVRISLFENLFSKLSHVLIKKFAVNMFPVGGINNLMFNNKIKDQLNQNVELNSSIFLQILNMGFKSTMITCDYIERKKGKSKWTFNKKIKIFIDTFVSFSFVPIRLISIIGFLMAFFGFIFALIIAIIRIFNIYPLSIGWPTLICILMICFGVTNISLGVIAEYLWRTLDASRGRPLYIINEEKDLK
jgi:dolichol-phosphate mannosyltransferase